MGGAVGAAVPPNSLPGGQRAWPRLWQLEAQADGRLDREEVAGGARPTAPGLTAPVLFLARRPALLPQALLRNTLRTQG